MQIWNIYLWDIHNAKGQTGDVAPQLTEEIWAGLNVVSHLSGQVALRAEQHAGETWDKVLCSGRWLFS